MNALLSRLNLDPYIASILGMVALASALPAEGIGMTVASHAGTGAIALMFFLVTSGANLYQSHRFEIPIIRRAPRARSYQGCRRVQGQSRPGPSGGREGRGQP